MKMMEESVLIHAPVEKVFAICADIERLPETIPGILKVEMLTPGPVAVGTKFKETRKMFGKEATEEMTVALLQPSREIGLTATSSGCLYNSQFLTEPSEGGTKLTVSFSVTPLSWIAKIMGKIMSPLVKGMMVKKLRQDLEHIKNKAEG